MFEDSYQGGLFPLLYSLGSNPLKQWGAVVTNGSLRRVRDEDINSPVVQIRGQNVLKSYISMPPDPMMTLGIKLPFLVMIIKNLKKFFTFEAEILDDAGKIRQFRASTYRSKTQVTEAFCYVPMHLEDGWNQVQFDLADFTRRAYGSTYKMTQRLKIHANCRLRRVYFADRVYSLDELPDDYKLHIPVPSAKMDK